jgi:excisionase family DNA binding protein
MKIQLALGLQEAAEAVGLSQWTLRKYVREGKIAAIRLGRRVLVEPSELHRLVEQGRGGKESKSIQNLEGK